MSWRDYLARFHGIPVPDWRTPADLTEMSMSAMAAQQCPPSVAAEQDWPRLHVRKLRGVDPWWRKHVWEWSITDPRGHILDAGLLQTQPGALAVGLAALEQISTRYPQVASGVSPRPGTINA